VDLPTLVIVVVSMGSVVLATLFMVALGRASARGDEYVEPRRQSISSTAVPPVRAARLPRPVSYAGTAGLKAPELCLEYGWRDWQGRALSARRLK
jgi:hypothetical protein